MKQGTFAKRERLKKNSSIKQVFDKGVPSKGRLINIYLLETDSGINRAAFLVRKNLYNKKSVLRNRFRRVLREAYRKTKHMLPTGHDIVILATRINKSTRSEAVERELNHVFKKYSKK